MPETDSIESCSFEVTVSYSNSHPECALKSPWKTVKNILSGHTSDQANQNLWELVLGIWSLPKFSSVVNADALRLKKHLHRMCNRGMAETEDRIGGEEKVRRPEYQKDHLHEH